MWSAAALLALTLAVQTPAQPDPATTAWPDDQPISRLFQNLGADLAALPTVENAAIVGLGGLGALVVHPVDDDLATWAMEAGPSSYTSFGRDFGSGGVQIGAAVVAYVIGRTQQNAPVTHVASDLIRAQALNTVITTGLKYTVRRARPGDGSRTSFPSGHTSSTFASAAVLQSHFGWKVGGPAYALAGFVGWTRVRDHVHFLSDVVMGAALGTMAGRTVTIGHRERVWRVVPTKTPGGVAVYVVRTAGR
ncbi:MAG: phosphatase PAP2 family protein [Vicinamibacterales bacterium]